MPDIAFADLPAVANHLRSVVGQKIQNNPNKSPFVLIYAFNGTGKTRLSGAYRDLGRAVNADGEITKRDTLYFNAYTEDLFAWDNDLKHEREPVLELNEDSKFFDGLRELELEVKIGQLLARYSDLNFRIDYDRRAPAPPPETKETLLAPAVIFFRERDADGNPIPIKVSRAEENIFIWCFFLVILQLALDGDPAYTWVEHVYIDDPISSLDEHNAIVVGNHLVQLYRDANRAIPTVVSTHHTLFFNTLHYELKSHIGRPVQYALKQDRGTNGYVLREQQGDTPQFYHVSALADLCELARQGTANTYHFNVLRSILEKTAFFLGYGHFGSCLKKDANDSEGILHQRFVDILSHGKYSMYEPTEMGEQTREYFLTILKGFVDRHPFNPDLVKDLPETKKS
ncbi:MAG TPA: anticodon nuclease [Pyrinomonadaceae bacterium]